MLHVGPVSQTCRIVAIDRDLMRTGDRASVVFEFCQRPYVASTHLTHKLMLDNQRIPLCG